MTLWYAPRWTKYEYKEWIIGYRFCCWFDNKCYVTHTHQNVICPMTIHADCIYWYWTIKTLCPNEYVYNHLMAHTNSYECFSLHIKPQTMATNNNNKKRHDNLLSMTLNLILEICHCWFLLVFVHYSEI